MRQRVVCLPSAAPRLLRGAVWLALGACSAAAHALDLGALTLQAQGRDRWQARIEVLDTAGLQPGEIVFRIAPAEVYRVAQRHYEPSLADASLRVERPRKGAPSVRIDGLQLPAADAGMDLLLLIGQGGVAGMREYHLSRASLGRSVPAVDPASRASALSAAAPRGTALRQANAAQQVTRQMAAAAQRADSAATASVAASTAASAAALPAATTRAITQALQAWTQAWSARDANAYIAHYTPDFNGSPPLGRERWEAQRRDRLLTRKQIEVGISDLQFQAQGPAVAVTLQQDYRSDKLQQRSRKVLTLVRRGEQWLISNEVEVR